MQRKVNMRTLVLLVCLSVCCLAQRPQPCSSPPMMSGGLSVSTQDERLLVFAKYSYDAMGKRIRIKELGSHQNDSFHLDVLLLYRQGVMYKINDRNRTCLKKRLTEDFHPLAIPQDAALVSQAMMGSSSVPGEGVLVNMWTGELQMRKGTAKYVSTVTELGCVPVSTLFTTDGRGWVVASFFNNIIGLADPQDLTPPAFCKSAQMEEEEEGEKLLASFSLF